MAVPGAQSQITAEICHHPEEQEGQPAKALTRREEKTWKGSEKVASIKLLLNL
jgi:hypothetical protein